MIHNWKIVKDRLQNYLIFCFQNPQSFKGFFKQFRASYFVTIPSIILLLICIPVSGFCQDQSYQDQSYLDRSHWDRAVGIAEKNQCWKPGKIRTMETVFDNKGKQVAETRSELQLARHPRPELTLVSYTENGKDKTASAAREFNTHKQDFLEELEKNSLFQGALGIKLTSMEIQGSTAIYTFTLNVEKVEFKGHAKIDIPSGAAFYTQITCLQMEDEDYLIFDYKAITHYSRDPRKWYPEKSIETMGIKTKGFFSSFTGRVREETNLTDYSCSEN